MVVGETLAGVAAAVCGGRKQSRMIDALTLYKLVAEEVLPSAVVSHMMEHRSFGSSETPISLVSTDLLRTTGIPSLLDLLPRSRSSSAIRCMRACNADEPEVLPSPSKPFLVDALLLSDAARATCAVVQSNERLLLAHGDRRLIGSSSCSGSGACSACRIGGRFRDQGSVLRLACPLIDDGD